MINKIVIGLIVAYVLILAIPKQYKFVCIEKAAEFYFKYLLKENACYFVLVVFIASLVTWFTGMYKTSRILGLFGIGLVMTIFCGYFVFLGVADNGCMRYKYH